MKSVKKTIFLFGVILLFISLTPFSVSALEVGGIPVIEEIELPQDLNLSVKNTCSEHSYFMQATADETGQFAVYSLYINPEDRENNYERVYIDIYNADGLLLQELSFKTPFSLAIELMGDELNIYFYKSVLVYNIDTQEMQHYSIADGVAVNGGKFKNLRSKEFVKGNWEYSCKNSFHGYTKLTRSNGNQTQVLVEMPGEESIFLPAFLSSVVIVIICLATRNWIKKTKNKEQNLNNMPPL